MRKTLIAILLALALVLIPVGSAFAASSANVTVTATPGYISITNDPNTWTINSLGGGTESGMLKTNTTYYTKPVTNGDDTVPPNDVSGNVVASDCRFTVTNDAGSNVSVDLTVTWDSFTGGGAAMTNNNDGSNGTDKFGAYCWYQGMAYASKVIVKDYATGSAKMYNAGTGLAPSGTLKWGVEIKTRTNDWTSATSSTSTNLTITATMH